MFSPLWHWPNCSVMCSACERLPDRCLRSPPAWSPRLSADNTTSTGAYWNEALETLPWAEVERRQAPRIEAMLVPLRERSALYAQLHTDVPRDLRLATLTDLSALPFTLKDHVRVAQDRASDVQPLGDNQAVSTANIVQAIASSGTTGAPLYYGLTAPD